MGFRRSRIVQMEWLRVIFACEIDHFFARDVIVTERGFFADFKIFKKSNIIYISDVGKCNILSLIFNTYVLKFIFIKKLTQISELFADNYGIL